MATPTLFKHVYIQEIALPKNALVRGFEEESSSWYWSYATMALEDFNPALHFYPLCWVTIFKPIAIKPLGTCFTLIDEYYGQHFLFQDKLWMQWK